MKKIQFNEYPIFIFFCLIIFNLGANLTLYAQNSGPLPDPGNLTAYRAQLGQTFSFRIRGHDAGTVWGGANGIYTDDSSLGKAAVHAGLLRIGEEGVVTVNTLGGQPSYIGNSQNGVTSINYGSFQFSFRFVTTGATTPVVTPPVLGGTVLPDPGNLTAYRAQLGQTFSFRIRGHDAGTVWGGSNGIYTDDSSLGKAAVHAGLLRIGEEGVVTVNTLGGQPSYTGNSQNGVTSINYGSFQWSFRFVTTGTTTQVVTPPVSVGTVLPDPGNLAAYRSRIGQTFSFRVKGTDAGSVWGGINGPYTDDSSLGKAAVHASLLKIGEEGIISVTILGGQPSYTGNIQNGITSLNYGSYQGSFRFVNLGSIGQVTTTPVVTPPVSVGTVLPDPGNLTAYRAQLGQTLSFRIRGHDAGTVWGGANGIYTDDSSLGKAAVHAGLLRIGEERVVTVTILGGQSSYTGNSQNGVTSINYGSFQWSFRFK